jgi:RNA polymerase-interacting CarD/CdnL/TRCF family regulator
MDFQVGDKVVHWVYGPGEVVQLDEKMIAGGTADYYVVRIAELTIWVPRNDAGPTSLRLPTPAGQFTKLFEILSSPPEPLPSDRFERKTHLLEQVRDGTIESICRVVRDLSFYKHTKKMNDVDNSILERAQKFLLDEWQFALSVPDKQAERELKQMLGAAIKK